MSFDVHIHPWTRDFMLKNGPIVKACNFFNLDLSRLPRSTGQLLDEMDDAGVARGVVLGQDTHATRNPSFKHYTMRNDDLAALASRSRGRLTAFAGVDPNAGGEAVRELRRAFRVLGMGGLKVHGSANSVFPNDRARMYPLYEICQDEEVPVLMHTGTTGLGDCDIRYSKPEYLDEVCQDFPDLKIVMAHFGWPWHEVTLAVALRNPNVYIDISGWRPKYIPPEVLPYLNGILQDRFLFGTDYPMLRHSAWVEDFESNLKPKLKPGVSQKLLSANAKRLLAD